MAGAFILVLTAAAFWLSYAHLAEVAGRHGLAVSPIRQWAWPATLDTFIVIGELLMLHAGLRREPDGWAIALTAAGSVGSIALNVAGVSGSGDTPVPVLDYVVAAVPPTAALLAFGVLMRQVHRLVAMPDPGANSPPEGSLPDATSSVVNRENLVVDSGTAPLPEHPSATSDGLRHGEGAPAKQAPVDTVAQGVEQVAESRTPTKKRAGRKAAVPLDELLVIARNAPTGRNGRASSRHIEKAVRAHGLPIGRDRRDELTLQVQAELDKATSTT